MGPVFSRFHPSARRPDVSLPCTKQPALLYTAWMLHFRGGNIFDPVPQCTGEREVARSDHNITGVQVLKPTITQITIWCVFLV